jgi:uncharacterized protein (TIGR02757 family)
MRGEQERVLTGIAPEVQDCEKMPGCRPPDRDFFERLYRAYNHRKYVHPDPLEFVYQYPEGPDREVVGLIASCLAYGRVAQIRKSIGCVLDKMGESPFGFLKRADRVCLGNTFAGFRHRFTDGAEIACLLWGIKTAAEKHGSLERCFASGMYEQDETCLPALDVFVKELSAGGSFRSLLPSPSAGSACKRLNLFLKWMVRKDDVDPGCWKHVSPSKLIMPLDTHIFRICSGLGITSRKSADMKTALEITGFFRSINPKDPIKYDFALTRPGIWNGRIPQECRDILISNGGDKSWMTL